MEHDENEWYEKRRCQACYAQYLFKDKMPEYRKKLCFECSNEVKELPFNCSCPICKDVPKSYVDGGI